LAVVEAAIAHHEANGGLPAQAAAEAAGRAAIHGHTEVVQTLLCAGADATLSPEDALPVALSLGHEAAGTALLEAGASVHELGEDMSPLMGAVAGRCGDLVAYIIRRGADVNYITHCEGTGRTALSYAADPDIVRALLDAGAEVNPRWCRSVLVGACLECEPAAVRMLLDAGADPQQNSFSDEGPLQGALMIKCADEDADAKLEIAATLLPLVADDPFALPAQVEQRALALCGLLAEDACTEPVLRLLLEAHPGMLGFVDRKGRTALYVAVEDMEVRKVSTLISLGADVNVRSASGTPLVFAAVRSDYFHTISRAVLGALLAAGADLAATDSGETVFMAAAGGEVADAASAVFIRDMADAVGRRGLAGTGAEAVAVEE
jgi:ankyrin repeat protein